MTERGASGEGREFILWSVGDCAICRKQTTKSGDVEDEPFICNTCLVDLHKASFDKLTTLQRVGRLENSVERIDGKLDDLETRSDRGRDVAIGLVSLLAGSLLSVILTLMLTGG